METTFISIHDLSPECRILYSSDSIVDILGYSPEEVVNQSCWDFFHPDELPIARSRHEKGIQMDKAAVLSYCTMKDRDGHWLGCEVVFTVVYDVLVGCTSIYRRGLKSESRASKAPVIRRLFSSSPRDPRYHMLSHLSTKFSHHPKEVHEPRAAIFLNRYTRTLTIMYATNGLSGVLGMSGEEMKGKSFYYCIQENCLKDAVKCLENAKANDSIAYLRFWFRDPRLEDRQEDWHDTRMDIDGEQSGGIVSSSDDHEMDGVQRSGNGRYTHPPRLDSLNESSGDSMAVSSSSSVEPTETNGPNFLHHKQGQPDSRTSSGDSNPYTHEAVFGDPPRHASSASSMSDSPNGTPRRPNEHTARSRNPIELEAVVSCTSDGLVVCLRRAKPATNMAPVNQPSQTAYENGLFAVPWSPEPILPPLSQRPQYVQSSGIQACTGAPQPLPAPVSHPAGPSNNDFMNSIRDIAVFAWALNGINGSLAAYSRGIPRGEAQPAAGLPIWQPEAQQQDAMNNGQSMATRQWTNGPLAPVETANPSAVETPVSKPKAGPPPNFSLPLANGSESRSNGAGSYFAPR